MELSNIYYTCANNKKEGHGGCDKEEEKVRNRVEKYIEVTSWVRKQSKDKTFLFY